MNSFLLHRFSTVILFLTLAFRTLGAAPPTIAINSVTPDGPWQPGDSLKITMNVSYTDAPYPGRVDFILREVSEKQTKDVIFNTSESTTTITFGQQSAAKTLTRSFYNVPNHSCLIRRSTSTEQCISPATFTESLTKLSKIQLMARLLDGNSNIVASAIREVDLAYPEVTSVSVQSQPLMSERHMQVVVAGARFTEAENIYVGLRKANAPQEGFFPAIYGNPALNRACTPPRGGAEGLGYCDAKIINDTTIEFMMRTFVSTVTGGNLEADSALEKFIGEYDVHVHWIARQPSPEGFYYRAPDAPLVGEFTITPPLKDDFVEFKKITLTKAFSTEKEEFVPGGNASTAFTPNTTVTATVEFEYKLSRRLGGNIFFAARKIGETGFLGFPRGGQFWNTAGQVVSSDGSEPPRRAPVSLTLAIPADGAGLEFSLIMTDIAGNYTQEEAVFVRSKPLIVSLDKLEIANVLPLEQDFKGDNLQVRADVSYHLVSRPDADLVLRVFDLSNPQNPVLLASSFDPANPEQFHRARRADGETTLHLITAPFKLPPGLIKAGIKAVLIDRLQPRVFLESAPPIEYDFEPPTLKVETKDGKSEIFAGDRIELKITPLRSDGTPDPDFSGQVILTLSEASDKGIGVFDIGTGPSDRVVVTFEKGVLRETVSFRTPARQLNPNTPITPDTLLKGKAVIVAELSDHPDVKASTTLDVRSPLDLIVDRIEVQQAVRQSLADQNPLILGKPALVRVFVTSNTERFNAFSWVEGVKVKLVIRDGAGNETTQVLDRNGSLTAPFRLFGDPLKVNRSKGDDSFGFIFTPHAHPLNFKATLEPGFAEFPDEDKSRNSVEAGPATFASTKSIKILYSPVRFDRGVFLSSDLPSDRDITEAIRFCMAAYPLAEPNFRFVPAPAVTLNADPFLRDAFRISSTRFWQWLNRLKDGADARLYLVDHKYFEVVGKLGSSGETFYGLSIARADRPPAVARELGRTFGLRIQENARNVDDGSFVSTENVFAVVNEGPSSHRDFMAEPPGAWIDSISWNTLRSRFITSAAGRQALNVVDSFAIIEGSVRADGNGQFGDCYVLTGSNLSSLSEPGTHTIEILDASSAILERLDFTPEFQPDAGPALNQWDFSFALRFSAAARTIQLRRGSTILDTRNVSASPPTVRFDSDFTGQTLAGVKQVRWTGSDPDGDALRYSLFYSPDGEVHIPLAEGINGTSFDWNTDEAPSGPAPRLLLVATDGLQTAMTETPQFALADRAPEIFVVSPEDGSTFAPGEAIHFQGAMLDPEDGLRSVFDFTWTSDKQGALGNGSSLLVTNLIGGTHLITAAGADSAGRTNSGAITVNVSVAPEPTVSLTAAFEGGTLHLSWPASAAGFTLESARSLTPPVTWTPVIPPTALSGDRNIISVSLGDSVQFYRLVRP